MKVREQRRNLLLRLQKKFKVLIGVVINTRKAENHSDMKDSEELVGHDLS
jgi:hypothetical protein